MIEWEQFKQLLPLACVWAAEQERTILRDGVALAESQLEDARRLGVAHPEKVRLLGVTQIPIPAQPELAAAAAAIKLISPRTEGMAFRYGIYFRKDCLSRLLVAHELVHTSQYERLGGLDAFLRQYLLECNDVGYPHGPLEREACTRSEKLCAEAGPG